MKLNKQMNSLLTRDVFRNTVFERDNFKCVICKAPAKDAHHIIERRLFDNGGYFISNGASLCEKHHIDAEMTTLSCKDIRDAAGIDEIVLPEPVKRPRSLYNPYDEVDKAWKSLTQQYKQAQRDKK